MGFWGFGVLGFQGFGVLGFWGFGVSRFQGSGFGGSGAFKGALGVLGILALRILPPRKTWFEISDGPASSFVSKKLDTTMAAV